MSKRIADLTPVQLQQGILNLDGQLEAADDAVREAADRRAELGAGSVDARGAAGDQGSGDRRGVVAPASAEPPRSGRGIRRVCQAYGHRLLCVNS